MTTTYKYKCDGCEKELSLHEYYNKTENLKFIDKNIYTLCMDCGKQVQDFIVNRRSTKGLEEG